MFEICQIMHEIMDVGEQDNKTTVICDTLKYLLSQVLTIIQMRVLSAFTFVQFYTLT